MYFIEKIDGIHTLGTDEACGETCLENDLCNWYTNFPEDNYCTLYSTCEIEEICDDCFTSEKECANSDGGDEGMWKVAIHV